MSTKIQPMLKQPTLNRNLASDYVDKEYPHLFIEKLDDTIALILDSLDEGDIPILCEYKGDVLQIRKVRRSAIIFNRLRKVAKVRYVSSPTESRQLSSVEDIMEVL